MSWSVWPRWFWRLPLTVVAIMIVTPQFQLGVAVICEDVIFAIGPKPARECFVGHDIHKFESSVAVGL